MHTENNTNCVLITAYTPTLEKTDSLRELVRSIKNLGYEVCLATHTSTPQDIIDRCDYFIFDKKNELNYDPSIAYWIYHETAHFKISYKQYDAMATHIVPIMRLVGGGLSYLKSLGIHKVCMIEYDTLVNDGMAFEKIFSDLDEYDLSSLYTDRLDNKGIYLTGLFGINLLSFDVSLISTDPNYLLDKYREYFYKEIFPVTERLLFDNVWSKYTIAWNDLKTVQSSVQLQTSEGMNGYGIKSYLFHTYKDKLWFFAFNESKENWVFNIIVNEKNHTIPVPRDSWKWIPLAEINDVNNIKLILNNTFIKDLNLNNKSDHDLIHKWVIFKPKLD